MEVPKTINKHGVAVGIGLLLFLAIVWRLTPHVPNFAPVSAVALLVSTTLGWRQSLLAVLVIMGISDSILGGYAGIEWTWLGFGLITLLGYSIRHIPLSWRIPVGAFGASSIFFIVSNFGTWIASGMYSLDLSGLLQCYTMALPFLKATALSDLVFTATFLAANEFARAYVNEPARFNFYYYPESGVMRKTNRGGSGDLLY